MNFFQHDIYHNVSMRPDRLRAIMPKIIRILKRIDKKTPFDSIACRGVSGALMAAPIAYHFRKNLILVRKDDDQDNHSTERVMGDRLCQRYIVVDDFCASGHTVKAIQGGIYNYLSKTALCLGVLQVVKVHEAERPYFLDQIGFSKKTGHDL